MVSVSVVLLSVMALNPNYDAIGKAFAQQYYALFDDPAQRPQLANLYNVSDRQHRMHLDTLFTGAP